MNTGSQRPAIAIHGGAGNLARYKGTGRIEEATTFLGTVIDEIHRYLEEGMSAMDAVTEAVVRLEDIGYFHAGKGSSPNTNDEVELDASIMDGSTLHAGAVALVQGVKNPIRLARVVLQDTKHVMMSGPEAMALARKSDLELVRLDIQDGVIVLQ